MTQKICKTMRDRDASYKLAVIVGIDASLFNEPKGSDKRGKGDYKCIVIIKTSSNSEGIGYVRMTVVKDIDSVSIIALVKTDIRENQMDKTDDFVTYNIVVQMGHKHKRDVIKGKKVDDEMKWIYILISNAKTFIMDTFQGIGKSISKSILMGYFVD